jgi:DNA-binding response OmpR family regulator
VPVLFMSGYAEPILDAQGLAAQGMDLVEKPFTEATLLARVRKAVGGAQIPRPRDEPPTPSATPDGHGRRTG